MSLHQRFLRIGQGIPGLSGIRAHLIRVFRPLLHIDRVDLGCDFIRRLLVRIGRRSPGSCACPACLCTAIHFRCRLLCGFRVGFLQGLTQRGNLRDTDFVIIPFSLCSDQRHIILLVQIGDGNIEAVGLIPGAVTVLEILHTRL